MKLRPRISRMVYSPGKAVFIFFAGINDTANTLLLVHSGILEWWCVVHKWVRHKVTCL